jgi:hypothetical protein
MSESLPAWLSESTSLEEAVSRLRESQAKTAPPELWKRLSLVSSFDNSLYEVLSAGLQVPSFAKLSDWATVRSVPEGLALSDETRKDLSPHWDPDDPQLRIIAGSLGDHFRKISSADRALLFDAIADPDAGLAAFSAAYKAADGKFDLSRCADLLELLRTNYALLDLTLRNFLNEREQYLRSRALFADDYYQTVLYVERAELAATQGLMRGEGSRMLNLYGKGGLGKTMLVKRLIAHECVPETSGTRIPVARVDLDFVNLSSLAEQPWLLLLEAAFQLQPQMVGGPFQTLIGPEERSLARQLRRGTTSVREGDAASFAASGGADENKIQSLFKTGVGAQPVLLVIDTMEEIQLHYPQGLARLLQQSADCQASCPNLRILFSGRYPLLDDNHPIPLPANVLDDLRRRISVIQITEFDATQARGYLTMVRRMPEGEVVEAIVQRAGGNPFVLSLFAELAQGKALLTRQKVWECPDAKLAYLVERVIDRIPNEEPTEDDTPEEKTRKLVNKAVLWVLRYAVVPRDLTRDYLDHVLAPYVIEESGGRGHDNTELPGIYSDRERWPREEAIRDVLDRVWNALESYASNYGWISEKDGVLHLQPEVVQPMRELLRQNRDKYGLFDEIHEASWKYFESHNNLIEAAYHHFQVEGSGASATWKDYMQRARSLGPQATANLADFLLQKIDLGDGVETSMIANADLAESIEKEGALAGLVMWLHGPARDLQKLPAPVKNGGTLLDAAAAARAKDDEQVKSLLKEDWIAGVDDGNQRAAACLLLATVLRRRDAELLDRVFDRAIDATRSGGAPWFSLCTVLGHAARRLTPRRASAAIERYDEACFVAVRDKADAAEVGQLLLEFGDVASANGQWSRVAARAQEVLDAKIGFPAIEEARGWLLNHALLFGDMETARKIAAEGDGPAALERKADLAAAEFRASDAEPLYESAEGEYEKAGFRLSKVQVQLKRTRMVLEQVGNVNRAEGVHKGITHLTEAIQVAEFWRLRYQLDARSSPDKAPNAPLMEHRRALTNLPNVHDAIFTATVLGASGDLEPKVLIDQLERLDSDSARWAALIPLAGAEPGGGRTVHGNWKQFGAPPDGPDFFLHMFGFLAGCRYFGDAERWGVAGKRMIAFVGENPYLLVRAIPLLPAGIRMEIPTGDAAESVWTHVHLEAAQHAWFSNNVPEMQLHLATLETAQLPPLHRAMWRCIRLQARWATWSGHRDVALPALKSAHMIAGQLGDHSAVGLIQSEIDEVEKGERTLLDQLRSSPLESGQRSVLEKSVSPIEPIRKSAAVPIEVRDGALSVNHRNDTSPFAVELAKWANDLYSPHLVQLSSQPEALASELRGLLGRAAAEACELRMSLGALHAVPWELAFDPKLRVTRTALNSYAIEIPQATPGPPRVVVLQADAEAERYSKRGYGVMGIRVADFYAKAGAKVESISLDDSSWQTRMQSMEPSIIHIASGFWDSQQPRDALLDVAPDSSPPMGPSHLAGVLERTGHVPRRPMVILDLNWDPYDGLRQVLLRNCFGGTLWGYSPIRAVLAIGAYQGHGALPALELLAQTAVRRATLSEIFVELRTKTQPMFPPALFTNHPDARIY